MLCLLKLPRVSSNDTQSYGMFIFNHAKKTNSKLFEYTHFMNKNNVVLEIECNLMKDIQWSLSRTNPFESKEQ